MTDATEGVLIRSHESLDHYSNNDSDDRRADVNWAARSYQIMAISTYNYRAVYYSYGESNFDVNDSLVFAITSEYVSHYVNWTHFKQPNGYLY